MLIYYLFFLAIFFLSFLEINIEKKVELRIVFWVIAGVLVIMAALRYKTGFDIDAYRAIFDFVDYSNFSESLIEPGSFLVIVLIHTLGLNFQFYLFSYALVAVLLKFRFFAQYSPYLFLSALIYFPIGFLINELGQIRHGLAIGIVLIAFGYLFQNKTKWFFIYSTLAIFFHLSAFIVLPVYFFVNRNIKSAYLILSIYILSGLLFIDSRPFLLSILDYVPIPAIQSKMTLYLYSEEFGSPLGFNFSFVLRFIIFIVLVYFKEPGEQKFFFYKKLIWLYYYGILLYIVFNSVSDFAIRTSVYFKTLDCLILPCIITLGKTRKEKVVLWSIFVLYAFYSLYKLLSDPATAKAFIPYRTIFS